MTLDRVVLVNFGPHAKLDVDMAAGIFGIIGPNGGGKTNFLQAIYFVLTKDTNGRKKESYIRNFGAEDGATKATVEAWFHHNGGKGYITRTITASGIKGKLEWDGNTYTKEADIARCMEEIIGVDKAALNNSIFTKQGCIADIVTGTPGERQTLFFKLLNLAYLDSRSADLAKKIEQLRSGVIDYGPALDEVRATILEYKDQISSLDNEIAAANNPEEALRYLNKAGKLFNDISGAKRTIDYHRGQAATYEAELKRICREAGFDDFDALKQDKDKLEKAVDANAKELQKARKIESDYASYSSWKAEYDTAQQELKEAKAAIPEGAKSVAEISSDIASLEEEQRLALAVEKLQADLDNATQAADAATKDKNVALAAKESQLYTGNVALCAAFKAAISNSEITISNFDAILNFYDASGTPLIGSVCPTCGQAIPSKSADEIQRLRDQREDAVARLNTSKERLKAAEKQVADLVDVPLADAEYRLRVATQLHERCRVQLAAASEGKTQPRQSSVLAGLIKEEKLRLSGLQKLEARLSSCQTRCNTAERNLKFFGEVAPTPPVEGYADKVESDLKAQKEQLKKLTETYNSAYATSNATVRENTAKANQEVSMQSYVQQLEELLKEIPSDLTADDVDSTESIRAKVAVLTEEKGKLDALKDQKDNVKALCDAKELRERELVQLIGQNAKKLQLVRELSEARAMILKTGTPTLYMSAVFRKMTPTVNKILSDMGANFTVIPDPDLPITYRFIRLDKPSCIDLPQEALSGGQAIRLALAILIAVQKTILKDVGLLVLDEPSSHIDAEGVANMATMFRNLGSVLANSETQLIVVDHNPSLIGSFEKSVTLGDAA